MLVTLQEKTREIRMSVPRGKSIYRLEWQRALASGWHCGGRVSVRGDSDGRFKNTSAQWPATTLSALYAQTLSHIGLVSMPTRPLKAIVNMQKEGKGLRPTLVTARGLGGQ